MEGTCQIKKSEHATLTQFASWLKNQAEVYDECHMKIAMGHGKYSKTKPPRKGDGKS